MSSHVSTVARKEFDDAGRSKLLWSLIGLLVGLVVIGYVAIWYTVDDVTAAEVLSFLGTPLQVILPVAALIAGYMAVVGERRSGSIKLLLGLPPNRTDVLFGKLLGRTAVVGLAVALAFLVSLVLGAVFFGSVPFVDWLGFAAISLLFGITFVGLAVGVSAAVSTRGKSMAIVVGLYMVFVALWGLLTAGPPPPLRRGAARRSRDVVSGARSVQSDLRVHEPGQPGRRGVDLSLPVPVRTPVDGGLRNDACRTLPR